MHDKIMYKAGEDSGKRQNTMLFSCFISLSIALCFVMSLTLADGNQEETGDYVESDVIPNDLTEKRSLIAKQSMLLGKWNKLGNKSLKDYLKSFRRREYFGKRAMIGGGRWGKRSDPSNLFMGKRPRPLRMGKRSSGYHDNVVGQKALKMQQIGLRMGKRNLENEKRSLGGPLGWEIWK